jgi:hypothetical protein
MKMIVVKAAVLILLLAAAYASNGLQFDTAPVRQIADARTRSLPAAKPEDAQNALTDADIVETQARPLFSASRRPFVARVVSVDAAEVETAAAAPEPVATPRRIRLLGVNIFGADFMALVQNQESAEIRWIGKGQEFDGWILTAADKESAHFACARDNDSDCRYDVDLYTIRQAQ